MHQLPYTSAFSVFIVKLSNLTLINQRRSEDCRFSLTKVRKTRTTKPQPRRQAMDYGAADPVTPLSRVPSSPSAQAQPGNFTASPASSRLRRRSIDGNSEAEAQFEPSGDNTLNATDQVASPNPVNSVIMVV